MFKSIQKSKLIFTIVVAIIASAIYNPDTPFPSFAQENNNKINGNDEINFHSNIEQIIGHIEKAEENKNNNNDTLAYGHTSHPIEEVIALITVPLNNTDPKLNDTYYKELYSLSSLASPSGNSTKEQFSKQAQSAIDLSNKAIDTVIPAKTLNDTSHNITVIQDLLTTSQEEYSEGVKDGKILMVLEYQDGSAFMNRAHDIFKNTKSIVKEREEISALFDNLTSSVQHQKDPSEIDKIINNIKDELSGSLSTAQNTSLASSSPSNNEGEKTSQDYISNIRILLNQTISAYSSNDTVKANELAITAYLDNFEHIEKPIGKELSDQGEALMREKLRGQISSNEPIDNIKQTINDINKVLDEAQKSLSS